MKNHYKRCSYFFILILCLSNIVTASADVDAVDMWDEPRHQLLFSRDHVRLLLVNIPAGDTSLLHKHEYATSYVLLEDASMTSRDAEGEWSAPPQRRLRKAGEIADRADYYVKPFSHQVRNVGTSTFTTLAVVNTHAGQFRPVEKGGDGHDLLLENDWFREHRLELSAGEVRGDLKTGSEIN